MIFKKILILSLRVLEDLSALVCRRVYARRRLQFGFCGVLLVGILGGAPRATASGHFDHLQEGVYQVQLSCRQPEGRCNQGFMDRANRLTITSGAERRFQSGEWVSLSDKDGDWITGFFAYEFGPGPAELTCYDGRDPHYPYIHLKINPVTGELTGELLDIRSTAGYKIAGFPLFRAKDLVSPIAPAPTTSIQDIIGLYRGDFGPFTGSMIIKSLPNGKIIAQFESDPDRNNLSDLTLSFDSGYWDPENGLLTLVGPNPRFPTVVSFILAFEEDQLSGFYYSTFVGTKARFKRVKAPLPGPDAVTRQTRGDLHPSSISNSFRTFLSTSFSSSAQGDPRAKYLNSFRRKKSRLVAARAKSF